MDERQAGALQAAIDAHDAASGVAGQDRINLATSLGAGNPFTADTVTSSSGTSWDIAVMQGGATAAYPRSSRSAFAPGYLTQADILTAIGPVLTARSDTFLIRAYGQAINPVTGADEGQAWCEAVVQRLHDFVDDGDDAETWPASESINGTFGRRYRIVSFRWLTAGEI